MIFKKSCNQSLMDSGSLLIQLVYEKYNAVQ